ncbi:MAG: pyruvate, phosphate dikinase [Calditrichaeota bacterium]|nr:pyruvate, phosphate dikinase [Calditrichota bacterium]
MSKQYVYSFGGGKAEGNAGLKNLLGGKGANLAEMCNLGLPVPAGFTISTEVCTYFYDHGKQYPQELEEQVLSAMRNTEKIMGAKFGDTENPLLVSVRSGARVSMPGMMDTVLNLGLNDKTVEGLIKQTDNPRFAYDSYRRFVAMYGDVVMGMRPESHDDIDPFEELIHNKKAVRGIENDTDLTTEELKELVSEFKAAIKKRIGQSFPEDPMEQLWGAVGAVFGSWQNDRAIVYRRLNKIPAEWGTAVNVQSMVYGNMGEDSGTGVAFTRDPATGEKTLYGEYLINAQGEDVVAGVRTPAKIKELHEAMPEVYDQFAKICGTLEKHYRDMQDMEFTIQKGRLWMLQTRAGKRTGAAAFRIAVDQVEEGLISKEEALMRVQPDQLNQLLRPVFDPKEKGAAVDAGRLLTIGLNAGPGAAAGRVVFNASDAVSWTAKGEAVILVRLETSPEDIQGMDAAEGILTARGGMTSHAALVGRQMGKVCVVGAGEVSVNYKTREFHVGDRKIKEGDWISLDGSTGEVIEGRLQTQPSEVLKVLESHDKKAEASVAYHTYERMMTWADEYRRLKIRTNADQPDQAKTAIAFGAEGIGLCRTEHMFFEGDRITAVREMIVATNQEGRRKALQKLLPIQREDFVGLFREMAGKPVTIRLLDPPLHEFLPHTEAEQKDLAAGLGISYEKLKERVEALHEFNPMLGHRGCRLGLVYPEITEMQVQAILEAACQVKKEGVTVLPEIMVPLVSHVNELKSQETVIREVGKKVFAAQGLEVDYMVGTMIEIPRAAITADEIAEVAEFFSFGTNDLTQTAFGMSRDDAGVFLPWYVEHKILPADPFQAIDQGGVGKLMDWAVEHGRKSRPKLKVGICGEHGGEPSSVEFCHGLNLDYVSCSPFRVPIARLAAAQAALRK